MVPFVAVIGLAIAALNLLGWAFDIGAFKSVLPGLSTLKANGAVGSAVFLGAGEDANGS